MVQVIDGFDVVVPRITGGLSAVSSSLIIYTICRSVKKLGTIYHRLMFGMSCADILGSVAIGLTTLPLPKDITGIDWQGTRLGNVHTSEAQVFFVIFGMNTMFAYNAMLCVYYACAIAFKMNEHQIMRRVEPFLHVIPLVAGLGLAVPPLFTQLYNPTVHQAWWAVTENANLSKDIFDTNQKVLMTMLCISISSMIIIVITCFALIIWRVYRTEKLLASFNIKSNGERRRSSTTSQLMWNVNAEKVERSHKNTKVVMIQAFAYLGSFFLTLLFPILRSLYFATKVIARLSIIFIPLQGFFNALIFISHKIYNYRRVHEEVSRWETFKMLLQGTLDEPVLFSRISQIGVLEGDECVDVELADEEEEEKITVRFFLTAFGVGYDHNDEAAMFR